MNSFFSQHPQRPKGKQAADLGEAVVVGEDGREKFAGEAS